MKNKIKPITIIIVIAIIIIIKIGIGAFTSLNNIEMVYEEDVETTVDEVDDNVVNGERCINII